MIVFENSIEIRKPAAEVFEFIAHLENVPKWNYYVVSVQPRDGSTPRLGATYHQVRRQDEQTIKITDYQPNQRLVVETTPGSKPAAIRRMTFEALPIGTRITDQWQLGVPSIIGLFAKGKIQAAVAENLGKLKELLENGSTYLQDGRLQEARS
jgi:uncharacterized membrane protein